MSKTTVKDTKKELEQRILSISSEVERLKRNAETMLRAAKQQEIGFLRMEEEKKIREKQRERNELVQNQTKAWTMPDDDVKIEAEKAEETPKKPLRKKEEKEGDKPKQELKAEQPSEKETKAEKVQEETPVASVITDTIQTEVTKIEEKPSSAAKFPKVPIRNDREQRVRLANQAQGVPQRTGTRPEGQLGQRPQGARQDGFAQRNPMERRTAPREGGFSQNRPLIQQRGQFGQTGQRSFERSQQGQRPFGQARTSAGGFQNKDKDAPTQGYGRGQTRPAGQKPRIAKSESLDVFPALEKERVSNYDPNKKSYEQRNNDVERSNKSKPKAALKSNTKHGISVFDDEVVRGSKKAKGKKVSVQQTIAPIKIEKAFMTAETITVKDLSERTGKPVGEILKAVLLLGTGGIPTINSELDFDTAFLVCSNFGIELEIKIEKSAEEVLKESYVEDSDDELMDRPPVITIMGHVDHGKTSLLDYIRRAHVTSTEAGGITQHIGAYSVNVKGNTITFLDTPGHEAFTAMRARGAKSTDIAILVVAADDGVMPQTVEAINHARAAEVPIIVAINKMDKESANPERIKQDLTAFNIVPEEWGGDAILVPVSAKTGEGVDNLLEMILLQAEVMQLKANPNRLAKGIIIEAKLDKNRGALATVLLQNGTLKVGDNIIAGHASGRIRAMQNDRGERVLSAGPSMPVEISGFDDVPDAGDELFAVDDERLIRQVAQDRKDKIRTDRIQASSKVSLDNLFANISEGKIETLNIIIKADVQGSSEAVRQALEKLSNEKVKIKVLHSGVGAITKDDVNLAVAFNAIIIGFNIRPDANARIASEKEEVDIRLYRVIYQAIEDMEKAMKGMLAPVMKETILGHAEVRDVFKITGAGTIAGSYVTDGKMQRNASVRLLRDNVVIFEGKLSSLRRFKDDVKDVSSGYECGIGLANYNDIKNNDIIECFTEEALEE